MPVVYDLWPMFSLVWLLIESEGVHGVYGQPPRAGSDNSAEFDGVPEAAQPLDERIIEGKWCRGGRRGRGRRLIFALGFSQERDSGVKIAILETHLLERLQVSGFHREDPIK